MGRSALIRQTLDGMPEIRTSGTIMAYAAFGGEADINDFWLTQGEQGKRILLPRVEGDRLEAVLYSGWDKMQPGPFGIREPLGEPFPPAEIDIVLVPGLVFDTAGHRLGYGKGYYDRFLIRLPETAFFCGIAFDFQMVEDTFPGENDVRLHEVVTELGRKGAGPRQVTGLPAGW